MSEITLHYFNLHARGEAIRMIFHYHGVQFNERSITFEEWPAMKTTGFSEFAQLPVLEIDGERLVQSQAIVRYICQKYGYYPSDPKKIYQVESLCDLKEDFFRSLVPLICHGDPQGVDKWYAEQGPQFLQHFERRLAQTHEGKKFLICNYPSMADFHVFQAVYDYFLSPTRREKYESLVTIHAPLLRRYMDRFIESSPAFKEYILNRVEKPF